MDSIYGARASGKGAGPRLGAVHGRVRQRPWDVVEVDPNLLRGLSNATAVEQRDTSVDAFSITAYSVIRNHGKGTAAKIGSSTSKHPDPSVLWLPPPRRRRQRAATSGISSLLLTFG